MPIMKTSQSKVDAMTKQPSQMTKTPTVLPLRYAFL
jgi:hypothetical protein